MKRICGQDRQVSPSGTQSTGWYRETVDECVVVTAEHRVLPFASWDDAIGFYREQARLLDQEIASARFFICQEGEWREVARPEFAN